MRRSTIALVLIYRPRRELMAGPIKTFRRSEPVVAMAVVQMLISSGLTLGVAFGLTLTADQITALLGFVNPLLMLISALVTRRLTWAPATVEAILESPIETQKVVVVETTANPATTTSTPPEEASSDY